MLDFSRILLPLDLEEPSLPAVHQASALSRHFHSEILILHVIKPLSYLGIHELGHGGLLAESIKRAEARLDKSVAPELDGIVTKRLLLNGDPARLIVQTAHEEKAQLIVMGPHGFGVVERLLVGSVTAKVLSGAGCPVWTGAHLDDKHLRSLPIRNVLCGVDFDLHSHHAARWAAEMAAEFHARLTLAHVTCAVEIYGPGGYQVLPEFKEAIVGAANKRMAKLQQETGITAATFIGSGDVAKVLNQAVKETEADLLVVGCRHPGGRLGSNAYAIIRESHVPVLSV
jgi:nucleotide-binding universal stress UspA family protein